MCTKAHLCTWALNDLCTGFLRCVPIQPLKAMQINGSGVQHRQSKCPLCGSGVIKAPRLVKGLFPKEITVTSERQTTRPCLRRVSLIHPGTACTAFRFSCSTFCRSCGTRDEQSGRAQAGVQKRQKSPARRSRSLTVLGVEIGNKLFIAVGDLS